MVALASTPHGPAGRAFERTAPRSRFAQIQQLEALREHRRYLTHLLAAYTGPYRTGWAQELDAVLARIGALNG